MVDFKLDPLPKDFVLYKPLQQDRFDEKVIYELEKAGRLIITRKRDGWKMFAVKADGKIKLYTDGMNEIDDRLGHIKNALGKMKIPDGSILVGEAIADKNNSDQFKKVGQVMQSSVQKAIDLQKENDTKDLFRNNTKNLLRFMVFDVVCWGGKAMLQMKYQDRFKRISQLCASGGEFVSPLTWLLVSFDEAKRMVKRNHWEGLVLYDKEFLGSYRLDGKNPARPKGCYKWKPLYEDDFIIRKWLPKDDNPKILKEVVLLQIHPKTGKEFECGKLGSFDAKMREQLRTAKYPLVMEVMYEARYESGKLRNARFMRLRPDKKLKDCVAPKKFK
ncbi:MAG: hypothetical protein G01um10143_125 [Parcubacteria group bacterium Gr01-1014_3]|nr:MAG: hypothetical protein G01um10143_125 [Parcubacteria group bacterium Gr01-1014_3]